MSSQDACESHHRQQPQRTGGEHYFGVNCETVTEVGWYVLRENQQPIGPCAFSELREHFSNGYLLENSLVWSEGRSEWQPWSTIPELWTGIYQQGSDYSPAVSTHDDDDEFERWRNQIKAECGGGDSDRPLTPPEGEEEFTDDDRTKY